jgi:uncharacterized protein (TIGR02001 family)
MSSRILLAVPFAAALLAAPVAQAQDKKDKLVPGDFTATVTLGTDYLYRGISQTDENPTIQGSIDYSLMFNESIGIYAGLWASNLNFRDGNEATIEIDVSAGVKGEVAGFTWQAGMIGYFYPGASSALNYDFYEFAGKIGYDLGFVALSGGLNYSPDFFGKSGDAWYVYGDAKVPIPGAPFDLALIGHLGHQWIEKNLPLMISSLIRHADRNHGDTEIVSRETGRPAAIHRYTYPTPTAASAAGQRAHLARREAGRPRRHAGLEHPPPLRAVLRRLGHRRRPHTINPRLFPEQIATSSTTPRTAGLLRPDLPAAGREARAALQGREGLGRDDRPRPHARVVARPALLRELINAHSDDYEWPEFDEGAASSLCYTSGTTGNPKGVLYSHRSTVLHAYGSACPTRSNLSARDVVLPVVPMFHVNAWGLPYSAPLAGAKLVLPGAQLDGASLHELFEPRRSPVSAGVPTVWLGLLQHMKAQGAEAVHVKRLVIGGSAAPPAMIAAFEEHYGVTVLHAWGMTEMSPLGTVNTFKASISTGPESRARRAAA